MNSVETELLAKGRVPATAGHSVHKGTPREAFVKEFLAGHLSEQLAVGTGEIIDSRSQPGEARNQIDIVIYRRNYPKINLGGNISAFLVESVVATIEVKSKLTKVEFRKAVKSAQQVKQLRPSWGPGYAIGSPAETVFSYVVAYDGPKDMRTVYSWIAPTYQNLGIPAGPIQGKYDKLTTALDGVFVLGKGAVLSAESSVQFLDPSQPHTANWEMLNVQRGSLLALFMLLTQAGAKQLTFPFDASAYIPGLNDITLFTGP